MATITIDIDGTEYPFRTDLMGSAVRFYEESGKDVSEINLKSTREVLLYVYCCLAASCSKAQQPLPYTFTQFADNLSVEQMQDITAFMVKEVGAAADEKKR